MVLMPAGVSCSAVGLCEGSYWSFSRRSPAAWSPWKRAAVRISAMRGFRHWRWHLDEMYVKLNGEMVYLWRAVDHEGEILESYVTKTRDKNAALTFIRKALTPENANSISIPRFRAAFSRAYPAGTLSRFNGNQTGKTQTRRHLYRRERRIFAIFAATAANLNGKTFAP